MYNVYLTPDELLDLDLTTYLNWCDDVGLTADDDWHFTSATQHEHNHILAFASSEIAILFRLRFNV